MSDQNTRFLLPEQHVRGQIVQLKHSYQSILANADYPPDIARLLGQALAAVAALGSIIKLRGSIILQVQGDGPLHTLVAQANNAGEIRGLAHGYESIGEQSGFTELLAQGRLVMTIDGEGTQRYQGIVSIEGEQLSSVLDRYFEQSEQLLTHIHLAADGQHAACFLLQQMPGTGNTGSGDPETGRQGVDDDWQHLKILSQTLSDEELLTLEPQTLLHRLFHEQQVQLFEPSSLIFRCRCSREKVIPVIRQMSYEQAMQLVDEEGEIRADCEFCNQSHRFDRVDVAGLFKAAGKPPGTQH